MKYAFVFAALALLIVAACGQKPTEQPSAPTQPTAPVSPTPAPSADAAGDLDQSVAEVDSLTSELDTSSIDSLDAELAAIDSLDLG